MILSKKRLRIIANPFAVPLDSDGRPCAMFMHDPEHPRAQRYIGASVTYANHGKTKDMIHPGLELRAAVVSYDLTPAEVVDTIYHRRALKSGELLPADAATAKFAGIPFTDPIAAMTAQAASVSKAWSQQHDDVPPFGAWKDAGIPPEVFEQLQQAATSGDGAGR